MTHSYPRLIRQLANLANQMRAHRDEAEAWYQRQCTGAERAVVQARQAVRDAETELAAARRELETTETESAHLWRTLRGLLGPASRRVGDPPVPVPADGAEPAALLTAARELLDRARQPGELPPSARPLLALFGVLGAAAAFGVGSAARLAGARYGGDLAVAMPALALVVSLLGPVVGLAPARLLADRRHAGLDLRAALVVVVTGLITTGLLVALYQ